MKIAIHHENNSFSERWIDYCQKNGVEYKVVNCYSDRIIDELKECVALLWHHHHGKAEDVLFAKGLLFSLEQLNKKVFPDFNTGWHFDDKIGQKYLLEVANAPMVNSFVFYNKKVALNWSKTTSYPKVFKLRGGAGATNVSLIKSSKEARIKINRAFGKGFSKFNRSEHLKETIRLFKNKSIGIKGLIKGFGRSIIGTKFSNNSPKERGYAYFQEFIPNNDFDIRVVIIGNKAFGLKRYTRENDFRASGSGKISYEKTDIDLNCVKISFEVNAKLNSQCIAYDFVFDSENKPLIVEISYGFGVSPYDDCPGYWDRELNWYKGKFNPQFWMIENLLDNL